MLPLLDIERWFVKPGEAGGSVVIFFVFLIFSFPWYFCPHFELEVDSVSRRMVGVSSEKESKWCGFYVCVFFSLYFFTIFFCIFGTFLFLSSLGIGGWFSKHEDGRSEQWVGIQMVWDAIKGVVRKSLNWYCTTRAWLANLSTLIFTPRKTQENEHTNWIKITKKASIVT